MFTVEEATSRFGFNPLAEVVHATSRVQSACGKDQQFQALARMAKSDIVETRVYNALCEWLSSLTPLGRIATLQEIRKFCLQKLAVELSARGLRESVVALSRKQART